MTLIKRTLFVLSIAGTLLSQSCTSDQVTPTDPVITVTDFTGSIDENPTSGQEIGTLDATTSDGTLQFSLTSESVTGAFTLEPTGRLLVNNASIFDFEVNPVLTAVVSVSVADVSESISVTVSVNDVAEAGQGLVVNDFSTTIFENPTAGDLIGTLSASSTTGAVSFTLATESASGAFLLDQTTGALTVGDASLYTVLLNPTLTGSASVTDGDTTLTLDITVSVVKAPVIYTGPDLTFTKSDNADPTQAANQDRITDNVWITRGNEGGQIYNAKTESSASQNTSPADTEWAIGTTANLESLTFDTFRNTIKPKTVVGENLVLHLITDDVYIDIRFTSWSQGKAGGFSYVRATAN